MDEYQDLLRISVASAGNDHRLGANEAPPAVVSIFLGDELQGVLDAIEEGKHYDKKQRKQLKIGVDVLPKFPTDTTDRNRTSPFAFTGNKFEFRMLGSNASIACANIILNTAVAAELEEFADYLEKAEDFTASLNELVKKVIKDHKRIIFNGNGYDDEWIKEAEKRGLMNLKTTPDALPYYVSKKNLALFTKQKVFTETEARARYEIALENYCKVIHIEALTALNMLKTDILPAVSAYQKEVADVLGAKQAYKASTKYEQAMLEKLAKGGDALFETTVALEKAVEKAEAMTDYSEISFFCKDVIIPAMADARAIADSLEAVVPSEKWPYPSYGDLLFSVK